ncbi:Aldo keto reductase [Mycena sp. CBHHK59/15]|nr:Aldo keto reductase [Mycena sp. CBHHK59/15]
MSVAYTRLGDAGLRVAVPIMSIGCMSVGSSKGRPWVLDEDASVELLKAAWERGFNTFDTANTYSNGESEKVVGLFMKKYNIPRHKIIIATKVYNLVVDDIEVFGFQHLELREQRDYVNQDGLSRAGIFNVVEACLERLGTPYIDLLQIHRFDLKTPIEETMRALHDLIVGGKVRYIGASSMRAWCFAEMNHVAEKNGWMKFVSMQSEYSLLYREEEREMIPYCKAHGIGLIPWAPLAEGALARPMGVETTRTRAAKGTVFEISFSEADAKIISRVQELAKKKGCTMSQIALAWVQLKIDSPIVGISSVERMEQSLVTGIELSSEEVKYLEEL